MASRRSADNKNLHLERLTSAARRYKCESESRYPSFIRDSTVPPGAPVQAFPCKGQDALHRLL